MDKRGLGLLELLGAIIIFGLMVSMLSVLISFIINASDKISEKSRANTEGMYLISTIDSKFRDFGATDYQICDDGVDCIIIESHFQYVLNEDTQSIDLETYDPALKLEFEIIDGGLYIDGIQVMLRGFTLHEESSIETTVLTNTVRIKFYFVLVSDDLSTYAFTVTKSFEIQEIPQT
ncbi:MAG: hypothetical protein NUK62_05900 [Tenericutes bacterium]|nr:hypothetical protein [Mycoplasmatota bacterium]